MRAIRILACALVAVQAAAAQAGDVNRRIIAELDPVAPGSAVYEEKESGVATSKWGALVDFNMGNVLSTGPEVWTGTFAARGPGDDESYRREDLWPGERHKIDAIRLRWNLTRWEVPQSMRGYFIKLGYSYTRINSRANRYDEEGGEGDALPVLTTSSPNDDTDFVTDLRHGAVFGFGNRWLLASQKVSINVGAAFTTNFRRSVTVDAKDPDARADYDDMIADLPDTRMSTRPTPEINMGVGFAW